MEINEGFNLNLRLDPETLPRIIRKDIFMRVKWTSIDRRKALKLLVLLAASAIHPRKALAGLVSNSMENARIVAVGGGAINILNEMIEAGQWNGKSVAISADSEHLEASRAKTRIQIGKNLCHGKGCRADLQVGKRAALEFAIDIRKELVGVNVNLIIACLGGGTGGGVGPLIACWGRSLGVPTIAFLAMPFSFEGGTRYKRAEDCLNEFRVNKIITRVHCLSSSGGGTLLKTFIENDKQVAERSLAFLAEIQRGLFSHLEAHWM